MMMQEQEKGPGAAATTHRAENVASRKPTGLDNANPRQQQTLIASVVPDNTGRKQALRLSLRDAVNAKCKSCIYDPLGGCGTWREQVQACPSANCPLHAVRPVTVKAQNKALAGVRAAPETSGASTVSDALLVDRLAPNGPISEQRRAA